MNSNRLSVKDFIVIYFLILSIVIFLAGFFVGAKTMERQYLTTLKENSNNSELYSEKEITIAYNTVIVPHRRLLETIHSNNLLTSSNTKLRESYQQEAQSLLSTLSKVKIQSPYLVESRQQSINSINKLLQSLQSDELTSEQLDRMFQEFLNSQTSWYRSVWLWSQNQSKNDPLNVQIDTSSDWNSWKLANIHQKNYIVSSILSKEAFFTLSHPEDFTVHIDAYLKSNHEPTMTLDQLIQLLISTNAVRSGDFIQNKAWYNSAELPNVIIYNGK